jgi:hypothetical protein
MGMSPRPIDLEDENTRRDSKHCEVREHCPADGQRHYAGSDVSYSCSVALTCMGPTFFSYCSKRFCNNRLEPYWSSADKRTETRVCSSRLVQRCTCPGPPTSDHSERIRTPS